MLQRQVYRTLQISTEEIALPNNQVSTTPEKQRRHQTWRRRPSPPRFGSPSVERPLALAGGHMLAGDSWQDSIGGPCFSGAEAAGFGIPIFHNAAPKNGWNCEHACRETSAKWTGDAGGESGGGGRPLGVSYRPNSEPSAGQTHQLQAPKRKMNASFPPRNHHPCSPASEKPPSPPEPLLSSGGLACKTTLPTSSPSS